MTSGVLFKNSGALSGHKHQLLPPVFMDPRTSSNKLLPFNQGNPYIEEDAEEIESLFEQDTLYRQSKFLAHLTVKASLHVG
jgi:hypothetical protein